MKENLIFLGTNLFPKDMEFLAKEIRCSVSTIKRYLSGVIPDNYAGEITAEKIISLSKEIIEKRTDELKDKLETI